MIFMKQKALCIALLVSLCFLIPSTALSEQVIFEEDFESGWGDYWGADKGIWEIGVPTVGPVSSYSGSQCAGTVLGSNYERYTDSRLISPSLMLPSVAPTEEIHLRFMNWFSYAARDAGYIQISSYDEDSKSWSEWKDLKSYSGDGATIGWWPVNIDLTDYASHKIKIAFYHTAHWDYDGESTGWYIDDIQIIIKSPEIFTGDFESDMQGWSISDGLWEIGSPEEGPEVPHNGEQCIATNLKGLYTRHADSRLISPTFMLPQVATGEEIHFRFWHWFSYAARDAGYIQISSFDNINQTWSDWESISTIAETSSAWSMMDVELTTYTCQRIRVAFYHTADWDYDGESTGWYIDDVRLVLPERFKETASQTGQPDMYEPDDSRAQAGTASLNSGTKYIHSFHQSGDQDWIKLYGSKNQVYTFDITDVGTRANLVLNIYDGTTDYLLKRFYAQSGCEKSVTWTCPESGLYYLATAQVNPEIYGDNTKYSLKIYPSFTVEPATITVDQDSSGTITIRGGKGPYKVVSSDPSVVSGQIFTRAGVFVQVQGVAAGTATLSISDSSSGGESQEVEVTVTKPSTPATRSKAIIVAGGGPYTGNALWDTTKALANYVYITLVYQGFSRDTIQFLSPDTNVDLDGNGQYDEVDALATGENLKEAITEWASDADDLMIFITDHGGNGNFQINQTELLQATDFDQWVDELQQVIKGTVTIVYDACHSGSFLAALKPPENKKRIVISSTDVGQEAYFTSSGDLSFTSFFWQHVINGMNVYDAFLTAQNSIVYTYGRQIPQLDDNANGIGNDDGDGNLAESGFIGKGLISGGGIPVIDGVSPRKTLQNEETSAVLYAQNIIDSDGIARVWAVITRPDYAPGSPDNPVLEMPVVEMQHVGNNRYEGIYSQFDVLGTYTVAVYAKDVLGSIAVPAETKVVKSLGNEVPATFDSTTGLLSIPCADLLGVTYSMHLSIAGYDPLTFQIMPNIAPASGCSPCATFDPGQFILHINKLDLGAFYWVDLKLTGTDPIEFSIENLGVNQ